MTTSTDHALPDLGRGRARARACVAMWALADNPDGSPLERLADLDELRRDLEQRTTQAVLSALAGGATWAEVGAAVGVSKQTAHNRWSAAWQTEQVLLGYRAEQEKQQRESDTTTREATR